VSNEAQFGRNQLIHVATELLAAGIRAGDARYSSPRNAVDRAADLIDAADKRYEKTLSKLGEAGGPPAGVGQHVH
jgi:hypothetical protein